MFENVLADIEMARLERRTSLDAKTKLDVYVQRFRVLFRLVTPAILSYRFAHWVRKIRIPVARQLLIFTAFCMQRWAGLWSGVWISPDAIIGPGMVIHTPYGIHIGATRIGKNLTVQSGVLIAAGTRSVGDDVYFGAGAKVIGDTKIGNNVVIVANSLVLTDVPDNSTVVGVPARIRLPGGRPRRFWQTVANTPQN